MLFRIMGGVRDVDAEDILDSGGVLGTEDDASFHTSNQLSYLLLLLLQKLVG